MNRDIEDLRNELIGHKIVGASYEPAVDYHHEGYDVIQLDNGVELQLTDYGDCCACARIDLSNLVLSDNVITSVTTSDPEATFDGFNGCFDIFVLAGMEQVLEMHYDGDEGTGYYTFGVELRIMRPKQ